MAMMMGRAMRRPALETTPEVAQPAVNPMAAMAGGMPGMKKGGMAKGCGYSKGGQLAKANGVATKGKTKGTMIAMRSGGKTKSKMC